MTIIYIKDTGIIQPYFEATDGVFPDFNSATITQKGNGEFKVSNALKLKVTSSNLGLSDNTQVTPKIDRIGYDVQQLSFNSINLSLTCYLLKPKNIFTGDDALDLPNIIDILRLQLSKGHKDLYLDTEGGLDNEDLFSLYYVYQTLGTTDNGSGLSRKHLNVKIDSISFNEGIDDLVYNFTLTVLYDPIERT